MIGALQIACAVCAVGTAVFIGWLLSMQKWALAMINVLSLITFILNFFVFKSLA